MYIVEPGGNGSLAVSSAGKEVEELIKALDARDASSDGGREAGAIDSARSRSWNASIFVIWCLGPRNKLAPASQKERERETERESERERERESRESETSS